MIAENLAEVFSSSTAATTTPSFSSAFAAAPSSTLLSATERPPPLVSILHKDLFFVTDICKGSAAKLEWKSSPDPFIFGSFELKEYQTPQNVIARFNGGQQQLPSAVACPPPPASPQRRPSSGFALTSPSRSWQPASSGRSGPSPCGTLETEVNLTVYEIFVATCRTSSGKPLSFVPKSSSNSKNFVAEKDLCTQLQFDERFTAIGARIPKGFDSGGYNIKTGPDYSIELMKFDMSGSTDAIKVGPYSLPGARAGGFGGQVILPLAYTIEHEEFMEDNNCPLDSVTYNELVAAYVRAGYHDDGDAVIDTMTSKGIMPNAITYTTVINAYAKTGKGDKALKLFNQMKELGCVTDRWGPGKMELCLGEPGAAVMLAELAIEVVFGVLSWFQVGIG
ncbi:Tetratricopeptide-like helical domain superfamily [Sesbania bispinosa]|nr:Tetratricopeptide-like helical domain superfamily [Sesbania bispinosa]